MDDLPLVEILLAEDNSRDAELTIRALRKVHFANKLHWVKDGEEANPGDANRLEWKEQGVAMRACKANPDRLLQPGSEPESSKWGMS